MSADLVWAIIKNNNSFLVKRQNVQFSSEPANLKNVNSFKYSGLANYKVNKLFFIYCRIEINQVLYYRLFPSFLLLVVFVSLLARPTSKTLLPSPSTLLSLPRLVVKPPSLLLT